MHRRRFLATTSLLGGPLVGGLPAAPQRAAAPPLVRELGLPPALLDELERAAQTAIDEARWLRELPLAGINPAFVFVPRRKE